MLQMLRLMRHGRKEINDETIFGETEASKS